MTKSLALKLCILTALHVIFIYKKLLSAFLQFKNLKNSKIRHSIFEKSTDLQNVYYSVMKTPHQHYTLGKKYKQDILQIYVSNNLVHTMQ